MAFSRSSVFLDILTRVRGNKDVDKLGDSVEDLGDSMSKTARDADRLEKQIADTEAGIKSLGKEIAATGNMDLFKDLGRQQRELGKLKSLSKMLTDDVDQGRSAGRKIAGNLVEGLSSGLSRVGGPITSALSSAFGSMPPQAQAAIGAGLLGAVSSVAPAIGATLSGAAVAGLGAGAVAAGVAAAFTDPRVKGAAQSLGATFKSIFADVGRDFAGPTVAALRQVQNAARNLGLREVLAPAAGYLRPLTEGLIGLARNAMPGLKAAIAAAEKPIQAIAAALPQLGSALGSLFSMFARHAESGATALKMLFDTVIVGVKVIEMQINALATAFEWFDKLPNWVTGLTGVWADSARSGAQATGAWDMSLDGLKSALEGAGNAAAGAATKSRDFYEVMVEGTSVDLAAREARRSLEEAIDSASKTIATNGRTLDINTAKGRANAAALDQIRASGVGAAAAARAQGQSQEVANAILERARKKYVENAVAAGANRREVEALSRQLFAIPSPRPKVHLDTAQAAARARAIKNEIAGIRSKNVTVGVYFIRQGVNAGSLKVPGGTLLKDRWGGMHVPMAAGGVMSAGVYKASNPPLVRYAEPATGGEAYVPRRGQKQRSMGILRQAADWYGADVVDRGTQQGPQPGRAVVGGNSYTINVNVPPTANLAEVGRVTVEAINAYERRSGTRWRT